MKLTAIIVLAACMTASANSFSQIVTLSEKEAPLDKVFKEIKKQTGYVFFYDEAWLKQAKKVSIKVVNSPLKEVLDLCFKDQPLTFSIIGTTVVVKKSLVISAPVPSDTAKPSAYIDVRGVVKNERGDLLGGVSIILKGTSRATVTDGSGNFYMKNVSKSSILVFSALGHVAKELPVGENGTYTITLNIAQDEMTATVVVSTGYQHIKRTNVAGATSTIKASELAFNGTNTLEQALQGKLPGLVVINNDGLVGTRQKTIVRGVSTLTGTQDPIWVVDGIIQSDPLPFKAATLGALGAITPDNFDYVRNFVGSAISWLNPNDIEDITVLKDASATAIYGVRAANGVIVINTKKGKEGPVTVSYSNTVNISEKVTYDKLELMNSKERVAVSKEIFDRGLTSGFTVNTIGYAGALDDYLFGRITYEQFNARVKYLETVNVNWFDKLFRNPVSVNQSLSLSGGNANTRYYGSFGYTDTKGTAIGNDMKSYTANVGLNTRLSNKLTANVRISASQATTDGFYRVNPYTYASTVNRAIPGYDSAGNNLFYKNRSGYLFNINNELGNSISSNKNTSINTNFNINYDIAYGLRFSSLFSLNQSNIVGYSSATERTEYIAANYRGYDYGTAKVTDVPYKNSRLPIGGEYNEDNIQNVSWNLRNSLSYSHIFNLKHALSVMLGQEANSSHYEGFSNTNLGYLPERGKAFVALPLTYTSSNTPNPLLNMNMAKILTDRITNNMGYYGTVNYSYDNRYVFNFSVRADASNRFGQYTGEKFNPVYAGGVRWNMMYEEWARQLNWLSTFSLRSTFGYQRNMVSTVSPDLIARMPTQFTSQIVDLFTGEPRLVVSSLPYGDLRWEKTATVNLGVDFGFLKNRINGTVEYYIKKGKDIITTLPVPVEYGVASMPVNGGDITNRGLEISLGFIPVRTKDYTLSISFNTSKTYNTLNRAGIQNPNWRVASSGNLYVDGYPVSGLWAFDFTGIDTATGYPTINLAVANGKSAATDPTAYMKYMGKLNPDLTAGMGINFRYKMFSLSSSLYLQVGGKKMLTPAYTTLEKQAVGLPTEYENLSRELLGRWTPGNKQANFPGLPSAVANNVLLPDGKTFSNVYEMYNYSSARVVDASTLRINNINLSYTLPARITTIMRAKTINAGLGITNVFAWVSKDYKGRDAEVATGAQPRTRSFSIRFAASF
ncbi:SusC/RagA family TonB-linked outer membrane protein [Niastella caeni]|nr:SusC/RagA family TonB-linked outer membrane protein [Niastella caeni]